MQQVTTWAAKIISKCLPIYSFLFFLCLGCASAPPEPTPIPPTQINLQLISQANTNPDASNNPSPVLLRIYELKEQSNFMNADFFALFDKEQATLAADLVHKQEILLTPGQNSALQIDPDASTKLLGFFAAFRNLDNAQWRSVTPLNLHNINDITLTASGNTLVVSVKPPVTTASPAKPN
jgi:type VI secretion system protein VasD